MQRMHQLKARNMLYVNLVKRIERTHDGRILLDQDVFDQLLHGANFATEFDEFYYLRKNPDVAQSLGATSPSSAHDHYVLFGYKEGRLPRSIPVDERFYVSADPQLKQAVEKGETTPREHFEKYGSYEGRCPYDGFSLFKSS